MQGITAEGRNLKEFIFTNEENGFWCISNTMLCLMYTLFSFASICFVVMGRQLILSKRSQSVYMDMLTKPEDSEAEDDKLEAEKVENMLESEGPKSGTKNEPEVVSKENKEATKP